MTEYTDEILKLPELPVIEIIDDVVQVYKEYMVVRAALELGLFDWLSEHEPATFADISNGTGIKAEFVPSLLGTLFYLDMVRKSGDGYSLSPASRLHFVRKSRFYQGDYLINFSMAGSPWMTLGTYLTKPETKISFEPETDVISVRSRSEQLLRGTVQNIINILRMTDQFKGAESFLEIAGGTGLFAIAACQANPKLTAIVHASPVETEIAEENIRSFGMNSRISVQSKDIWIEDNLSQNDIVLISHSLYPFRDSLASVMPHIEKWIRPGGLFLSNHWFTAPPVGTGMQGLYELELGIHDHYHRLGQKELFEGICSKSGLEILQSGVIRSDYGESTIHMIQKPR